MSERALWGLGVGDWGLAARATGTGASSGGAATRLRRLRGAGGSASGMGGATASGAGGATTGGAGGATMAGAGGATASGAGGTTVSGISGTTAAGGGAVTRLRERFGGDGGSGSFDDSSKIQTP